MRLLKVRTETLQTCAETSIDTVSFAVADQSKFMLPSMVHVRPDVQQQTLNV